MMNRMVACACGKSRGSRLFTSSIKFLHSWLGALPTAILYIYHLGSVPGVSIRKSAKENNNESRATGQDLQHIA